jgi:hypothetical protein
MSMSICKVYQLLLFILSLGCIVRIINTFDLIMLAFIFSCVLMQLQAATGLLRCQQGFSLGVPPSGSNQNASLPS